MKKVLAIVAMLVIPGVSMAAGLIGDCYDCHTMHNSEAGAAVAQVGSATGSTTSTTPIANLLKLDCMACHAMNPTGADNIVTLPGGSQVPQVAHNAATDLAGGNFSYGIGGNGSVSKVHNVKELFAAGTEHNATFGNPPGMYGNGTTHTNIFSTTLDYDQFSCAGARGCHGTRQQLLPAAGNAVPSVKRTGMAAISGAHHNSYDGAKTGASYAANTPHDGKTVAAGYRFIPGLNAYGNTAARWQNVDSASHNEYYGSATGMGTGCSACHTGVGAAIDNSMKVPNNSMSGFCSTCHGNFHSAGGGDLASNGVSGAFLRHPSDYALPATGEYANYTTYNTTAPVARNSVLSAASATVTPGGGDMVMCLSCHAAHGTANDYILRFDYGTMYAGGQTTITAAQGLGGCLACHTEKGAAVSATGTRLP